MPPIAPPLKPELLELLAFKVVVGAPVLSAAPVVEVAPPVDVPVDEEDLDASAALSDAAAADEDAAAAEASEADDADSRLCVYCGVSSEE